MRPGKYFVKDRANFNLAKLRKKGVAIEIVVEPDLAIEYAKNNVEDLNKVEEIIMSQEIFFDAQKGELASEEKLEAIFNTKDPVKIASIILLEGEIQLTAEYRLKLREHKKRKLIELIHKTFVDPKTKIPHPQTRIENAMDEIKFKIDEFKSANEQLELAVKEIRRVLPLSTETRKFQLYIPAVNAAKIYGILKSYDGINKETWGNDGSLTTEIEISANLQSEIIDKLNDETHGSIDIKILD